MAFVEFTLFTPENPSPRTFKTLIEADEVKRIDASNWQTKDDITEIYLAGNELPIMVTEEYEDVKAAIRGARTK